MPPATETVHTSRAWARRLDERPARCVGGASGVKAGDKPSTQSAGAAPADLHRELVRGFQRHGAIPTAIALDAGHASHNGTVLFATTLPANHATQKRIAVSRNYVNL